MMTNCSKSHRHDQVFEQLPYDQGGKGRHKCAGCTYELGLEAGKKLTSSIDMQLDKLPDSQAGTVRHKSPHAAFALGYLNGVNQYYKNNN